MISLGVVPFNVSNYERCDPSLRDLLRLGERESIHELVKESFSSDDKSICNANC